MDAVGARPLVARMTAVRHRRVPARVGRVRSRVSRHVHWVAAISCQRNLILVALLSSEPFRVKVKERIVLREIHLRTTGRHLSMGSHSVICHPTEVTAPPSPQPGRLILDLSTPLGLKAELA